MLKTLALLAAMGLSGCAVLAPANEYTGHLPMNNYTRASIESVIQDGKTSKAELNGLFGYPVHSSPAIAAGMNCKAEVAFCIYVVHVIDYGNSVAYNKSLTVNFDKKNTVVSHNFAETRRPF